MTNRVEEFNTWRERDVWDRINRLQERLDELENQVNTTPTPAPASILNFVLNGGATHSHNAYTGNDWSTDSVFTREQNSAAHWYNVPYGVDGSFTYHSSTVESTYGLITSYHPDWASRNQDANWDKAKGEFTLGGTRTLTSPLSKNFIFPGQRVFVQLEARLASGGSITSSHQLEVSFWEDADALVESDAIDLSLAVVGGGSGTTRHYKLEIQSTNGTFTSNSNNISGPATLTPSNYISISWPRHLGVIQYKIYRSTDGGSTWKLIATTTGGTSVYDTGEVGTTATPPAAANPVARVRIPDFGSLLTEEYQRFSFSVPVPPGYSMPTSGEKHTLRIAVVNSSGSSVSITSRVLLVKRVGVSYNYGDWSPSSEDLGATGNVETTAPDPIIPPPDDEPPPDGCGSTFYQQIRYC